MSADWLEIEDVSAGRSKKVGRPRNSPVKGLILHHTEGSVTMDGNGSWSNKVGTGTQYYIDPNGKVYQWADDGIKMNHLGRARNKKGEYYGERLDLNNDNTLGIEIMTRPGHSPNAAQLKTTRLLAKQLADKHGFSQEDVWGHGETSPGHRETTEGKFANSIRTVGFDAEMDYEVAAQDIAQGTKIVDRTPVQNRSLTSFANLSPPGQEPQLKSGPTLVREGTLRTPAQQQGTALPEANKTYTPQPYTVASDYPAYEGYQDEVRPRNVAYEPGAAYDDIPASTNNFTPDMGGGDDINPLPSNTPVAQAVPNGVTAPQAAGGEVVIEQAPVEDMPYTDEEAEQFQKKRLDTPITLKPSAITKASALRSHAFKSEEQAVAESMNPVPEGPSLMDQAKAEFDTNWLLNWGEEAIASWTDKTRTEIDDKFTIPTELIQDLAPDDQRYVLESNNAVDYVARAAEIERRTEARAVLEQVGYPRRFITAVPDILFSVAPSIAFGYLAAPVAGLGTTAVSRIALGIAAEGVLNAPEHYYMYKSGQSDMTSTLLSLGIMAGFGIFVYRGAGGALPKGTNVKQDAKLMEMADDVAEDVTIGIAKEAGIEAPKMAPRSVEDYGYVPRVRLDEEASVPVYRDFNPATARESAINYDADKLSLSSVYKNFYEGTNVSPRRMADGIKAFERQSEYLQEATGIYVAVPKKFQANVDEAFKDGLIYGARTAGEVVSPQAGEVVVKLALPKGTKIVDLKKLGIGINEGSLLIHGTKNLIKRPGIGKIAGVGTPRTLRYAGEKVLDADGKPIKFTQHDFEFNAPTKGQSGFKQFASGVEKGTGRQLDLEELMGLNDDILYSALNKTKPNASKAPLEDLADDAEGELMGASSLSAGAVRMVEKLTDNPEDVVKILKEMDLFSDAELDDFGTLLSKAMPKISEARNARFNENKVWAYVAKHLFDFGSDPSVKAQTAGIGQSVTHAEVTQRLVDTMRNKHQAALIDNFRKYVENKAKAGGLKSRIPAHFQYGLRKQFADEINSIQRLKYAGKEIPPNYDPAAIAMAGAYDNLYGKLLKWLQDPGDFIGKPKMFSAVAEMDKVEWKPGWMPRVYDGSKIAEFDAMYGNPRGFNQWMAGALRNRLTAEGLDEDQIIAIADTMVNTIRKAKTGMSEYIDAFHMPNNARAIINAIKDDPNTKVSPKTLKILENLEMKIGQNADGKAGTNTFMRANLDELFELTHAGGDKISIETFVQTNPEALFHSYLNRNAGRIAFGSLQIPDPRGGFIVNGIYNNADWKKLRAMLARIEQETNGKLGESRIMDDAFGVMKAMDSYYDMATGNTADQGEWLAMLKNMSYFQYLGNASLAQAIELPNMIARHGFFALNRLEEFKNVKKEILLLGQQQDVEGLKTLISMLMRDTGVGTAMRRGAFGTHLDDEASALSGHFGKGAKAKAKLFAAEAARFTFVTSGLAPLTQISQVMASAAAFDKVAAWAVEAGGDLAKLSRRNRQELTRYGLSKVEQERFLKMLANPKVTKRKKGLMKFMVDELDESHPAFDREVWLKAATGINRTTFQLVQENTWSAGHRYLNIPAVRALMTLRTFIFGAYTKQMMRHTEQIGGLLQQGKADIAAKNFSKTDGLGDTAISMAEPVSALLGQIGVATLMMYALNELRIVGMDEDRKRDARKKLEEQSYAQLIGGAVSRTGTLGLIPTIWNTPMQYAAPGAVIGPGVRTSGLSNSLFGIPALGTAENVFKTMGSAGSAIFTNDKWTAEDQTRLSKIITNQWGVQIINNVLTDKILNLPKK